MIYWRVSLQAKPASAAAAKPESATAKNKPVSSSKPASKAKPASRTGSQKPLSKVQFILWLNGTCMHPCTNIFMQAKAAEEEKVNKATGETIVEDPAGEAAAEAEA